LSYLSFARVDHDGVVSTGKLTIDNLVMDTPNYFPALRTTQRPNELDMIISEKGKRPLKHVSGAVVRLHQVPNLVAPHTEKLKEEEKNKRKQTIFLGSQISDKSMYEIYYDNNLLLCDPQMERTYFINAEMDDRFARLDVLPKLSSYFSLFKQNISKLDKPDVDNTRKIRQAMYENLWFGSSKSARKDRNKMLTDLTKYQLQHFRISVPASHLIFTPEDVKNNIEINEYCQGLAYQAKKECATYFLFHKKAIKNEESMKTALDYLRENKQSKLNIVKFHDLDLHCPVDYKARKSFRNLLADIISIKENQPDRAFMILNAGTQYYVASQAFDIVSTTLTGMDQDITGGRREKGKKYAPLWYDELKMWPRPTDDAPNPNPEHCDICSITPNFELDEDILARRKRIHRLNDLDKDAKAICDGVTSKDVSRVMKQRVGFAEFSYARDLIFS